MERSEGNNMRIMTTFKKPTLERTIPPAFDGLHLVIDHTITRVPHLPEEHVPAAPPTAQWITPRTGEDTLTVGVPRHDTIRPCDQPPKRYH